MQTSELMKRLSFGAQLIEKVLFRTAEKGADARKRHFGLGFVPAEYAADDADVPFSAI